MKRVQASFRQLLSLMLVAAMVLVSLPDTALTVMAAEQAVGLTQTEMGTEDGKTAGAEDGESTETEDGESAGAEDGETAETEDGESAGAEDGETAETEDGESAGAEDGETAETEDGESAKTEDGESTGAEDGESAETEDREAAEAEEELRSADETTEAQYWLSLKTTDGGSIAQDSVVDCDTEVQVKSSMNEEASNQISGTYYYANVKVSVGDQIISTRTGIETTKYAQVCLATVTAAGNGEISCAGQTVTCEVSFYATSADASAGSSALATKTANFTYRTKFPATPQISLADADGNALTPQEGNETVQVGYGSAVRVTLDMGENKEEDCTYKYYYTTDGSTPVVSADTEDSDSGIDSKSLETEEESEEPSETEGVTYACDGAFTLTSAKTEGETVVIKAVAVRTTPQGVGSGGSTTSETAAEAEVEFGALAGAPAVTLTSSNTELGQEGVLNPNGESDVRTTFGSTVRVTIGTMANAEKIWYTIDGSDPSDKSNKARKQYTNVVTLAKNSGESVTIKTCAEMNDGGMSDTAVYSVSWAARLAAPVIQLNKKYADNRDGNVSFILVDEDGKAIDVNAYEGVEYVYTLDGGDPSDPAAQVLTYSGTPVGIEAPDTDDDSEKVVRAYARSNDQTRYVDSSIASGTVCFKAKRVGMSVVTGLGNTDMYTVKITDTAHGNEEVVLDAAESGNGFTFSAPKDAQLKAEVTAVAAEGRDYVLKQVSVEKSGSKIQTIKNNKAVFVVTAAEELSIRVLSYDKNNMKNWGVYSGDTAVTPMSADTYRVSPREAYQIYHGSDAVLEGTQIGEAQLYIGSTPYGDGQPVTADQPKTYEDGTSLSVSYEKNAGKVSFCPSTELAGQTVKLEVRFDGAEENGATTYYQKKTLTFKVAKVLNAVTVAGVKNGVLTQEAGTTKEYDLKQNPTGTSDKIGIVVIWDTEGGKTYDAEALSITEKGKLSFSCPPMSQSDIDSFNDDPRTVVLYNKTSFAANGKSEEKKEDLLGLLESDSNERLASFTLKLSEPAWIKSSPAVKQAGATDTTLYLKLTTPKGVTELTNCWYQVDYEQQGTTAGNGNRGIYYVSANQDTSAASIKVLGDEAAGAASFKVTAKLLQLADDSDPNSKEGLDVIWSSKESSAAVLKTKAAYYAEKVKLKKGTVTIYSGQKNVTAAIIDLGANTTYLSGAKAEVVGCSYDDGTAAADKVEAVIDTSNMMAQKVLVSVGNNVAPGKYTIRVTAPADEYGKAASADLVITVAAGIQEFTADVKGGRIYKEAGKAASAAISINYGTYNTAYHPKSAKFTYEVGRLLGDDSFEADEKVLTYTDKKGTHPAVTVNNGKITVNKNYEVLKDAENSFAVRVTAADYAGNVSESVIKGITITSEAALLTQLVIVKDQQVLVCGDTAELEAEELDGAVIYAVDSEQKVTGDYEYNAEKGGFVPKASDTASESEETEVIVPISSSAYTLTVSGKNVSIDDSGRITVSTIKGGVTIKAVANDGGKKTVSLKIKRLTYSEMGNARIYYWIERHAKGSETISQASGKGEYLRDNGNNELAFTPEGGEGEEYAKIGDELLLGIYAKSGAGDYYEVVSKWNQCQVSVSGGAKLLNATLSDRYSNNQYIRVLLTGAESKVTLSAGGEKTTYSITLKENGSELLTAPKVAGSKASLIAGDTQEQTITFKVTDVNWKNPVTKESKKVLGELMSGSIVAGYRAADAKSQAMLNDGITIKSVSYADGMLTLTAAAGGVKKAGSAKLLFYFTDGTSETALTKAVTVKSTALKKSFKVSAAKYTVTKAENLAAITYKGNGVRSVVVTKVSNVNKKGAFNHFTDCFGIIENTRYVKLKTEALVEKSDSEGYVTGRVTYLDGSTQSFDAKITMTVKESAGTAASFYKASKVMATKDTTTSTKLLSMPIRVMLDGEEQEVRLSKHTGMNMTAEVYSDLTCAESIEGVNVHYRTTGDADPMYLDLKLNEVAEDWKGTTKTIYIPVRVNHALADTILAVKVQIKDWEIEKLPSPDFTHNVINDQTGAAYNLSLAQGNGSPEGTQLYYAAIGSVLLNGNQVVKVTSWDELSNINTYMNEKGSAYVRTTGEEWIALDANPATLLENVYASAIGSNLKLGNAVSSSDGTGYGVYTIARCPGFADSDVKACAIRGGYSVGFFTDNPTMIDVVSE